LWKLTNAYHNFSKLVKLLHVSESLLRQMVDKGYITADLMNWVLDQSTPEDQSRALCDALKQQEMASFQQIVDCFRHSRENDAFLWVLEHEGGSYLFFCISYSSVSISATDGATALLPILGNTV